jgi:hypothetical protein
MTTTIERHRRRSMVVRLVYAEVGRDRSSEAIVMIPVGTDLGEIGLNVP